MSDRAETQDERECWDRAVRFLAAYGGDAPGALQRLLMLERHDARKKALEEAAGVADAVGKASHQEAGQQDDKSEHEAWENWGNGAQDVAERIRALKERP